MSNQNVKIKIFNSVPETEKVCASAAKISTTEGTCSDVYENIGELESARKVLNRIVKLGHTSVLEHSYFNIMFENVSLFFEQFLIEHRLSAYTIKSGRYVNFEKAGCYEPKFRFEKEIKEEKKNELNKKYMDFVAKTFDVYKEFVAAEIKVEDARFVLPYSLKTNIFASMNGRELAHLIGALLLGRGKNYPELVSIGNALREELKQLAPIIEQNIEKMEEGKEEKEIDLNSLMGEPEYKVEMERTQKPETEILDITDKIEERIAISAIIKNKQVSIEEAKQMLAKDPSLTSKILDIIFKDKRKRELEQINITFKMNNMPLILLKHQVRHRIQSINVPSFTEMLNITSYTYPPSITQKGEKYTKLLEDCYKEANELIKEFLDVGVQKEDLAYLFLHGKNIDYITTMNARNLYHICALRMCSRAQWKMQVYYKDAIEKLIPYSPELFKRFGPNCYIKGYCPEGKMTCGKMKDITDFYKNR